MALDGGATLDALATPAMAGMLIVEALDAAAVAEEPETAGLDEAAAMEDGVDEAAALYPDAEATTLDAEAEAIVAYVDAAALVCNDVVEGTVATGMTVNVTSETGFETLLMTDELATAAVWLGTVATGITVSVTNDIDEEEMEDEAFVAYTVAVR